MSKSQDLDRHCGPAAVAAVFARRPQDVMRLFHSQDRRREAGPHCAVLARMRRPYREVPSADLARIAGTQHHGGIVALALPRAVPALDARHPPAVLRAARVMPVLDGIGNPHNLGAIARSAAFFGCRAMVLSGDPRQAGLSDAAFRTSEGGLEALEVFRAVDLPLALRALAPGMLAIAAVPRGGVPPGEVPRGVPLALVLGNEEDGLTPATVAACPVRVTLPAAGPVESLNVSVAAAVLIHALSA
ncbi:TrmH family RNA methyltransferase [Neoroseomonas soli]|uniref:RNA methyltransferase n=1 Tax=Neoroseomonas soli TaxID=1081025 RepID=A0A9X9X222_9PROT|nr:RNA methyltransferase [Neoroseomonas soli]